MLAVRITDFGSLTTYGATVYSYTDNGFPVLGSISDVPVDVRNRGLYVLEWDYRRDAHAEDQRSGDPRAVVGALSKRL